MHRLCLLSGREGQRGILVLPNANTNGNQTYIWEMNKKGFRERTFYLSKLPNDSSHGLIKSFSSNTNPLINISTARRCLEEVM